MTDTTFPVMIKEEKIDKIGKKAEKILTVNHILELREKVPIPAGSAELVKVRVEENWKNEELVESMLPEEQEAGRELVLPEKIIICQAVYRLYT